MSTQQNYLILAMILIVAIYAIIRVVSLKKLKDDLQLELKSLSPKFRSSIMNFLELLRYSEKNLFIYFEGENSLAVVPMINNSYWEKCELSKIEDSSINWLKDHEMISFSEITGRRFFVNLERKGISFRKFGRTKKLIIRKNKAILNERVTDSFSLAEFFCKKQEEDPDFLLKLRKRKVSIESS